MALIVDHDTISERRCDLHRCVVTLSEQASPMPIHITTAIVLDALAEVFS